MRFLKYTLIVSVVLQSCEMMSMSSTKPKLGLSITEFKGTHEILKDYPGYEPFWGLVFAENDVAKNLYTFSTHQIKKEAAEIIKGADAQWKPLKTQVEDFLKDKHNTATQNLVRQMFHEVGGTFNVTNALNNPVTQFTPEHLGRILRLVHDAGADYAKMEADLKVYLLSLGLKDPKGKLFPGKDFNPFIKGLVGAVQECSSKNPDALFAPNTAQGIVLGYLLWKSNDRADLEKYFTGFLSKPVVLSDEQYDSQEFEDILQNTPDLQNTKQFAEFVCAMIYQEKYAASFPKLTTSKVVTFKGISFSDCMDSTMLDVVNIATYDQPKARLGRAPEGLTMSGTLTKFYSRHADPANIAHANVNQAWTDVVQNVIGVAYGYVADPETKHYLSVGSLCDGVIPIEVIDQTLQAKTVQIGQKSYQLYEKQVGDQNYWLVPQSSGLVCCDLMPTVSNIIVLMNHLFNLQLYPNVNAVFDPDFVKTYFANMCQKFGWRVGNDISKNIVIQVLGGKQFTIHLWHKKHGYIEISEVVNVMNLANVQNQIAKISSEKQAICTALGLKSADLNFLSDVFYMKLLDPNKRLEITKKCVDLQNKRYAQIVDNFVLSFSFLEDNHYKDCLDKICKVYVRNAYENFCDLRALKIRDDLYLILRPPNIETLLLKIQDFFDTHHENRALLLAQMAVEKGLLDRSNAAQVASWIQVGINISDLNVSNKALELARMAMKKELFNVAQITSWIQAGIDSENFKEFFSLAQIAMTEGLLDRSNATQIASWIQVGSQRHNYKIHEALLLAQMAIEKGLFDRSNFVQIASWIQARINREDAFTSTLPLAIQAVEKDIFDASDIKQLISWIQMELEFPSDEVRVWALELRKLVRYKFFKSYVKELGSRFIASRGPQGSMMAMVIGKGMLSRMQMDNMRAGLPTDLAPVQSQQQQFTPPSADELAHQRQAIDYFNQNQQAQQLQQQVPGYQPQQLQLPVGQQVPVQQSGMLARWRANMKNALRGGVRSVPR